MARPELRSTPSLELLRRDRPAPGTLDPATLAERLKRELELALESH
jgi:hypothetical protein